MRQEQKREGFPRLSFLPPEVAGEGMLVHEVELDPRGAPLAPFKASRFTVEPGCASPPDHHQVREIWMIAEGEGSLTYDGTTMKIRAEDVVYFEPMKVHTVKNDGPSRMVIFSIWW